MLSKLITIIENTPDDKWKFQTIGKQGGCGCAIRHSADAFGHDDTLDATRDFYNMTAHDAACLFTYNGYPIRWVQVNGCASKPLSGFTTRKEWLAVARAYNAR